VNTVSKFGLWLYKWLPIFFGCHCRDDRSFIVNHRKFPVCARCTGELAGILMGIICAFFFRPPLWLCLALMAPMVIDGFVQLLTSYESTNIRRCITGCLFGFALVMVLVWVAVLSYEFGYNLIQ